ncbi:ADOP family duplicated permease [Oleiharenicola lentus]|uniref:ADOP family duplicated permease n=1 Tax=Oleiharenicola lentus TaxID=2508720 RepID=UPI003F667181
MFTEIKSVVRSLRRAPGYALTVVAMLALGLGASAALYRTVMDSMFYYRAYTDKGTLVRISSKSPESVFAANVFMGRFLAYRESAKSLAEIAGTTSEAGNLVLNGDPQAIYAVKVTTNYFSLLGVTPVLGRAFVPEEGQAGRERVMVLSHWFWKNRLGADPAVLGREFLFNEENYRVVGVLPAEFNPPLSMSGGAVYVPYVVPAVVADRDVFMGLNVVARLQAGASLEKTQAELRTLLPERGKPYARAMEKYLAVVEPLDAPAPFESVRRYELMQRTALAAVGCLYAIATVNAGGLMLVRMLKRRRELAIRFSLGGSRTEIFRLLMWEGLLLAGGAIVLGAVLANWLMPVLLSLAEEKSGSGSGSGWTGFSLEPGAIGLLAGLGVASGLGIAAAMTLVLSRADLADVMKDGSAGAGESRRTTWLRGGLVVVEVALAVVLLAGAGLMLRTFQQLQDVKPGFDPTQRYQARIDQTKLSSLTPAMRQEKINQVLERLRAVPGVSGVGVTSTMSSEYFSPWQNLQIAGAGDAANAPVQAQGVAVSADFLEVLGVPLKAGRTFGGMRPGDAPAVVINESMARAYFSGRDPRGEQLVLSAKEKWEIVGVVGDTRTLRHEAKPMFYYPVWLRGNMASQLVIRTAGAPGASFQKELRRAVYEVDPKLVLTDVFSVTRRMELEVSQESRALSLLKVLSGLALFLAVVGLGAMMAYTVAQRRGEFGIRLALGATVESVQWLVLRRGLVLVALGVTAGLSLAWVLARFLEALLFQTKGHDPLTYGVVGMLMLLVALPACWLPARRAASVDLAKLLRAE